MVKQNWRYLLFLILSHHPPERLHRTIRIGFRRKHIYLCSRCTGKVLGIITIFSANAFGLKLPIDFCLLLISLLPLVATLDWFTQSAKLRESKNWLRISSGFLLGNSEALFLLLVIDGFFLYVLVALGIASIYAVLLYLIAAKTKCLDSYLTEISQIQNNSD
ncbi:MAG: DUF2085 domain-containing protein [Candidatus Bathyarchaeota archaeon]|nr:DUF2085 domain-containing protein [Candidatus Bathyarchaeum sp.]